MRQAVLLGTLSNSDHRHHVLDPTKQIQRRAQVSSDRPSSVRPVSPFLCPPPLAPSGVYLKPVICDGPLAGAGRRWLVLPSSYFGHVPSKPLCCMRLHLAAIGTSTARRDATAAASSPPRPSFVCFVGERRDDRSSLRWSMIGPVGRMAMLSNFCCHREHEPRQKNRNPARIALPQLKQSIGSSR